MKKRSTPTLLLFTMIFLGLFSCSKKNNIEPLSAAQLQGLSEKYQDSTLTNIESEGKMVFTHLKYYLGTVDVNSLLPSNAPANLKEQLLAKFKEADQLGATASFQKLLTAKNITQAEYNYLNDDTKSLVQFLQTDPTVLAAGATSHSASQVIETFCTLQEKKIKSDKSLLLSEKEFLLRHHTLLRYTLKWKTGLIIPNPNSRNITAGTQGQSSIWSTIACYAGSIATYIGIASGFGGTNIYTAVIGTVVGVVNATQTCGGTNTNVCQDPLTVSMPYRCYTYGNPLTLTAVGYGNNKPAQFVFTVADNDNLVNTIWSNFTANDNITIPGSYLTSSVNDIAIQCKTSCSNGNPLWFGWYTLSDLGKPYFYIYGTATLTVAQTNLLYQYSAVGALANSGASIQWTIIPSGYPGFSANGTLYNSNSPAPFIQWNAAPGIATLQCTATTPCSTITNYYRIQINPH